MLKPLQTAMRIDRKAFPLLAMTDRRRVPQRMSLSHHIYQCTHARVMYALALSSLFLLSMCAQLGHAASGYDVPRLIQRTGLVDAQQNRQIGEWALREIQQKGPLLQDPWLQDELSQMLNGINAQVRDKAPLAMVLIKNEQINAFAIPGGVIGINTGLVTNARSADEVASVLAHEVAHVSQRHFQRRGEHAQHDLLIQIGGLIASALVAGHNAEAASAIAVGSQAYTVDKRLAYSREHEREADRVGLQIMQSAGYDPQAMPTFFELMHTKNHHTGYIPSFALTHPLTEDRISESRERAAQMHYQPSYYSKKRQAQFPFIQWRMRALSRSMDLSLFRAAVASESQHQDAARMGLVTAYIIRKDYAAAQKTLQPLKKKYGEHVLYALNLAAIELGKGSENQAINTLTKALSLYPDNRALILAMGNAQRVAGKHDAAIRRLSPLVQKNPRDIATWTLLKQITEQRPKNDLNEIRALRYAAEVAFWKNHLEGALISLARAKTLATKYPVHLAKINKRTQEVTQAMRFQRLKK